MAVKQTFQLTQEGVDNLKQELIILKDVKRGENLEALKEARAQGDLSENADYDAARNEQARIEARISEIENIMKNVKIIKTTSEDIVNIGKTVRVRFLESKERVHHINGDKTDNRISNLMLFANESKHRKFHNNHSSEIT